MKDKLFKMRSYIGWYKVLTTLNNHIANTYFSLGLGSNYSKKRVHHISFNRLAYNALLKTFGKKKLDSFRLSEDYEVLSSPQYISQKELERIGCL